MGEPAPSLMAAPPPRSSRLCEVCFQPIPSGDVRAHLLSAHPDIVAVRKAASRRLITVYFPLLAAGGPLTVVSGTLHAWWWRIGLLVGMEAICGLRFHFLLWKEHSEKPLRLLVEVPCSVCGDRILSAALLDHLRTVHPPLDGLARQTLWMMYSVIYAFIAYYMILFGIATLGIFGDAFWSVFPILAFVPLVGALLILVARLALNRAHVLRARSEWRTSHPRTPPSE